MGFEEHSENIVPTKMELDIVYEDNYLLVINKSPNLCIHPSMSHFTDTLSNGIKYYFEKNGIHRKIRCVNRLDKDTSVIVIFAKNEYVQDMLILQMNNNSFKKEYIGILTGILKPEIGVINAPIARKSNSIIERCIDKNGQASITHYRVVKYFDNMSLVHFLLETR